MESIFGFIDNFLCGPSSSVVAGLIQFLGWEIHTQQAESAIVVRIDGQRAQSWAERYPRRDVNELYPALESLNPCSGFSITANTIDVSNGLHTVTLEVQCGEDIATLGTFEVTVDNGPELTIYKHMHLAPGSHRGLAKLKTIVEILRCPACGFEIKLLSESQIICRGCRHLYAIKNFVPIMIAGPPEYPVDEALLGSLPSNNPYPGTVLSELERVISTGGLALDIGSGRRGFGFSRLVQLEICAYPHTDVVNQNDRLPFRDESFDFVYALAVTEHVRRPWVLASEMERVLKKGGSIHVDSAFLQPLHGYPSHYFNMTHFALKDLFNQLDIVSLQPMSYQHPWYSLNWILDRAVADIAPEQKKLLFGMTFESVLAELNRYVTRQPSVFADISLPQHRIEELAAGFTLIGRKTVCSVQTDNYIGNGARAGRLREVTDMLAYPKGGLLVRSSRSALLLAHYWFWAKVHFRKDGIKAVSKRALRRLSRAVRGAPAN